MENTKTLHERMSIIKKELSEKDIPKSGHNKFSGFKYHELTDFMPFINQLNNQYGVNAVPRFLKKEGVCVLKLVNTNDSSDYYEVIIPYVDAEMLAKGGSPSTVDAIQRLGSTITYNRRYLYMAAYDITEHDSVDANSGKDDIVKKPQPKKPSKPVTKEKLTQDHAKWKNIVVALKSGYKINQVKDKYTMTKEIEEELIKLASE